MHHPLTPMSSMPSMPAASITTDQIQKYLDENKQLILAILENQNLGKLAECAQYQAQLQKNLLYLAAIADAQPQGSGGARPQMMPQGAIPPGAMPQGAIPPGAMPPGYMQQSPIFPPRAPLHLSPHQMPMQDQQQAHHQTPGMSFAGQMGLRPGIVNGMHSMQAELSQGGNPDPQRSSHAGGLADGRGSKQDGSGAASEAAAAEGHKSSRNEHGSDDADQTSKTP